MEDRTDYFSKLERLFLRIALLILLAVGLLKVIAPEVKSLVSGYFVTGQEASATKRQSEPTPERKEAGVDAVPDR